MAKVTYVPDMTTNHISLTTVSTCTCKLVRYQDISGGFTCREIAFIEIINDVINIYIFAEHHLKSPPSVEIAC